MKRNINYKPPFPWFGAKSAVADKVWDAIGDVPNFAEPFFGSGATLFLRPQQHRGGIETVNDADGFVANFWRALQHDPEAVAEAADNPVNECDLHARHLWLVGQRERITERLCGDPEWFNAKAAGWWCWGQAAWIAGGWCSGDGPWVSEDGVMVLRDAGMGVNRQRPHLSNSGMGVNRQRLDDEPTTPALGQLRQGEREARSQWLRKYLTGFADRLRSVRVCCGDWSRVCGPAITFKRGLTGVFLDPPYADTAGRDSRLYATDCEQVAHHVREWAITRGNRSDMRIVLCGYEGEHVMPDSWRVVEWQTHGGYGSLSADEEGTGRANRKRERLWLSPHCLQSERRLFA